MGIIALGMAYTEKQKRWIRERDKNMCQFPVSHKEDSYRPCGKTKQLQIHHIIPQRWARDVLKMKPHEIDTAENGITLCENHHQGFVHGIDMPEAKSNYHIDKQSYEKAFAKRNGLVAIGIAYWNTKWDDLFKRIATRRTNNYLEERHIPYPTKNKIK